MIGWRAGLPGRIVVGLMIAGGAFAGAAGALVGAAVARAGAVVGFGAAAGTGSRFGAAVGVAAGRAVGPAAGADRVLLPRWVSAGRGVAGTEGGVVLMSAGWSTIGEPRRMIASIVRSGVGCGAKVGFGSTLTEVGRPQASVVASTNSIRPRRTACRTADRVPSVRISVPPRRAPY